ncbi:Por secretion system C-terminal sorting domain-containing protein [Hymenobacter daecheongensis DSM 21074]|uniref:Por secretion system C-terminal sorting domain-containing protein n=1 Tax=Hymenobacter daecheongensis DSM 21074 TaxID=1121955 RepID=A0A1M6AXS7_9BACT|nr:Ig-like domain-containing protein [Hymenobacter daecheongensis]SHI41013.1 Por secretion system C-terminal sorting domain-containing protein [Hymenobacter daecheongensis DSM 21074]
MKSNDYSLMRTLGRWLLLLTIWCASPLAASAQTLVWQENFDGPAINPDNWTFDFGDGCERALCGWGNQELEYYTSRPENARIDNGNLLIEARREAFQGKSFTSARLKTLGRMHFKYGTLEARIKVPDLQNGLWPAFWLLGATGKWPASGEIDVMEMGSAASYPANVNNWAGAALHWDEKGAHKSVDQLYRGTTPLTAGYHVYKLQWDASAIKVFIDNVQYFSADISNPASDMEEFHKPQFVLLNLAVGGIYTGKMSPASITAPLPAAMLVDYVRLYQNPGDELYVGRNQSFAGEYGVLSERASITNKLAFDGLDANLYYWNNLTNITAPAPVPFEGQQVLAMHANANDWFGMGIENVVKNLGNFANGSLKFQFKTTYAGQFKVGVKSGHGESWINFPAGGAAQYGLVRDGSWHEVTIPLSSFNQPNMGMHIDLVSMNGLLMFAGDPATGPADFYFDDVRYSGGVAANPAPTVALTAPAPNAILTLPASISLAATAADANGTVAKVEFYQGSTLLDTDYTSPYSATWTSAPAGVYTLTAKATDDEGATTTSSPVTVFVAAAGNTAPAVSLTAPTANASFLTPASITLSADATDTGSGSGIYKVEFYQGSTLLGTDYTSPYSYAWTGAAPGSYSLTARATDTGGLTITSAAISISVADPVVPVVSITAPVSGTSVLAPATVNITATATHATNTIVKVEFYQGTTKLGEDTTAPYAYSWAGVAAGAYSLMAKATAADGSVTTSTPVALTVTAVPCTNVAANGEYRYEVFTSGGSVTFTFIPLGATASGNLALIFIREGSIGAYPGYPMVKNAAGNFTFTRPIANGTATSFYFTYQAGAGGPEHNTSNAPHSYTVGTICTGGGANNVPPTIILTSPTASTTFTSPATVNLAATAADTDGTVAKVEFYEGATKLGEATAAPYTYAWTAVPTGSYVLTAVATDNSGTSTTSVPVTIMVRSTDGSCATTTDYSFRAVTTGPNVTYTLHPLGAIAGGNLAIIYIREGAAGAYPGYPMVKNAAGDFTFSRAIASGTVTSVYFTYQAGPGGPEKNTAATPHTYTVGTSCGSTTTATTAAAAQATSTLHPNPLGQGRAVVTFNVLEPSAYTVALYDLKGTRIATLGTGRATTGQPVALSIAAGTLANGIYLVKVTTDTAVLIKRLVISR